MFSKTAILTGFSGQDGSYLAQLLLSKGYKVYGMVRRLSNPQMDFIKEMGLEDVEIVEGDLGDSASINKLVTNIKPDEFYNLAAMSHVGTSFKQPEHTANITGLGPVRILEAIKEFSPSTRFYQASTSEMFGNSPAPQNETTPFAPRSPYAAAKLYAHNMVSLYRASYGLYASASILMNHESERRSEDFLTRKVTAWIGRNYEKLKAGQKVTPLKLGCLDAKRDWAYAPDMVKGMWMILQQPKADDYVLGTGQARSVREFVEEAMRAAGFVFFWSQSAGQPENTIGFINNQASIFIDPSLYRPAEVNFLEADYTKARNKLGWEPSTNFEELVNIMVWADIKRFNNDSLANQTSNTETVKSNT